MLDLLWDIHQQDQISSATDAAGNARQKAHESIPLTDDVAERLERLSLLCQSMWELLSERCQVTKNELVSKVVEIDLRDGRQDGKMQPRVLDCPRCKNKVASRRPKCIVCGAVVATKHPFDV
jgi:hypothetical protein